MKGSILFVCTANICRSPLMQMSFLESVPNAADWNVTSAGISAREGSRMCELSSSLVRSDEARAGSEAHRSTQLDHAQLRTDLVIVASRAERSAIAQRSPAMRWRVFTLSEAVYLGRSIAPSYPGQQSQPGTVNQYAQLLDAQRGMLVLPRPRNQRRYLSSWEHPHPLDIPDGHHLRRRAHVQSLKRVRSEITELSTQIVNFRDTSVQ